MVVASIKTYHKIQARIFARKINRKWEFLALRRSNIKNHSISQRQMSYNPSPVRLVIYQAIDALASPHELTQMPGLEVQANMHPHVIRKCQRHYYKTRRIASFIIARARVRLVRRGSARATSPMCARGPRPLA